MRYGRLIGWGLLMLPRLGALPASEKSLGRAKNTDPASCRVCAGRVQEPRAGPEKTLTDEGEVVVAAGGVGDGRAAVGGDTQGGHVGNIAAVDRDRVVRPFCGAQLASGTAPARVRRTSGNAQPPFSASSARTGIMSARANLAGTGTHLPQRDDVGRATQGGRRFRVRWSQWDRTGERLSNRAACRGARVGVGVDIERETPWTRTPLTIW